MRRPVHGSRANFEVSSEETPLPVAPDSDRGRGQKMRWRDAYKGMKHQGADRLNSLDWFLICCGEKEASPRTQGPWYLPTFPHRRRNAANMEDEPARRMKMDAMRAVVRSGLADARRVLKRKALPLGAFAAVILVAGAAEAAMTGQISGAVIFAKSGAWAACPLG